MIKNEKIKTWVLISCVFLASTELFAVVKLPAIFSDGMVLQQKVKAAFWGWADAGEKISISAPWLKSPVETTTDANGKWKATITTSDAGGPYTITVKGISNSIELHEVLIGEVWLCSGQSNMGFTLKSDANGKSEIAKADRPSIRYFSVKRQYGPKEFEDCPGSSWVKSSPATAPGFSAIAYYFAKRLQEQFGNVPVGIVFNAWGGTPAEAWTPAPALRDDTILHRYLDRWKQMYLTVGRDSANYHTALTAWEAAKKTADSLKIKKPEEPSSLVWYNRPWREPSVLFNGLVSPVIPYSIKGVLWYQGESNVSFASEYYHLFSTMIREWRKRWNQSPELPFYFVQLAPNGYKSLDDAAQLRDAQYEVMKTVPGTGMAVTMDVGNMNDIHPIHKSKVGDRLARIAFAKTYGIPGITYKGPECSNAILRDGKIILDFSRSQLANTGERLGGFEIGYRYPGIDSIVFTPTEAVINDNKVVLPASATGTAVAVRYGWLLPGEANLFDKDGLPAFPFKKIITTKNN